MIASLFKRRRGLSCDAVMEVLQSYLDGEIDAETARRVATHLDDCSDCDLESSTYRRIKVSLGAASRPLDPAVLDSLRQFSARVANGDLDRDNGEKN